MMGSGWTEVASENGTSTLRFQALGYDLYLPPTPFKSRFVLFDENSHKFYDVDYATERLGNTTAWETIAPEKLRDPALVFRPLHSEMSDSPAVGHIGFLVSITRRENGVNYGEKLGRVWVKPAPEELMNWSALKATKGDILPAEIEAGLLKKLWDRRTPPGSRQISYVTPSIILDEMPRKWLVDGSALNWELDGIFASGNPTEPSQQWEVSKLEVGESQLAVPFVDILSVAPAPASS